MTETAYAALLLHIVVTKQEINSWRHVVPPGLASVIADRQAMVKLCELCAATRLDKETVASEGKQIAEIESIVSCMERDGVTDVGLESLRRDMSASQDNRDKTLARIEVNTVVIEKLRVEHPSFYAAIEAYFAEHKRKELRAVVAEAKSEMEFAKQELDRFEGSRLRLESRLESRREDKRRKRTEYEALCKTTGREATPEPSE